MDQTRLLQGCNDFMGMTVGLTDNARPTHQHEVEQGNQETTSKEKSHKSRTCRSKSFTEMKLRDTDSFSRTSRSSRQHRKSKSMSLSSKDVAHAVSESLDIIRPREFDFKAQIGVVPPPKVNVDNNVRESTDPPDVSHTLILSEEMARDALTMFEISKCCLKPPISRSITITSINPFGKYTYFLETFTEERRQDWKEEPFYNHGKLDYSVGLETHSSSSKMVPNAWNIPISPDTMFLDHHKSCKVPHTTTVRGCFSCRSKGRCLCDECQGTGGIVCEECGGEIRVRNSKMCRSCFGRGEHQCNKCWGSGKSDCKNCCGAGRIKRFLTLTVSWKTHRNKSIIRLGDRRSDLDSAFALDSDFLLFQQEARVLRRCDKFPHSSLNETALKLMDSHLTNWPLQKLIQQRHYILGVPLFQVLYSFDEAEGSYWVFGVEHKVYWSNTPGQKYCCVL